MIRAASMQQTPTHLPHSQIVNDHSHLQPLRHHFRLHFWQQCLMRHFGLRVRKKTLENNRYRVICLFINNMEEVFPLDMMQWWCSKYHLIVLSPPCRRMRKNIYVKFHFSKNQQQCANRMLSGEIWLDKRIMACRSESKILRDTWIKEQEINFLATLEI